MADPFCPMMLHFTQRSTMQAYCSASKSEVASS
jgi:hypothetical protein